MNCNLALIRLQIFVKLYVSQMKKDNACVHAHLLFEILLPYFLWWVKKDIYVLYCISNQVFVLMALSATVCFAKTSKKWQKVFMRLISFFSITVSTTSIVGVAPYGTIHFHESSTWHMSGKHKSPAIGVPLRSLLDKFFCDNPISCFFRASKMRLI